MHDVDFDGESLNVKLNKKNYAIALKIAEESAFSEYLPAAGILCLSPTKKIAKKLHCMGFRFSGNAKIFIEGMPEKNKSAECAKSGKGIDYGELKPLELRPYQKEGVEWLCGSKGHGLLGDEMGLGKSVQIASYLHFANAFPALIVCPSSLKLNWQREMKIWTKKKCLVLEGLSPYEIESFIVDYPVVIINYDILGRKDKKAVEAENKRWAAAKKMHVPYRKKTIHPTGWADVLKKIGFAAIVCDESQFIGERDTARTQSVVDICKAVPKAKRIFASGTPYTSAARQFFTTLYLIDPKTFSNRWKYQMDYCGAVKTRFGWRFKGLTNGERLHALIKPLMLRRLKKDVLAELPPKVKAAVPVRIDRKLYDEYKTDENYLMSGEKSDSGAYHTLKAKAYKAKASACFEWIDDYIAANNKLVVFVYHRSTFANVMDNYKKIAVGINGSTPAKTRQGFVDRFQNDESIRLFIGQIEAAGVGLTLTAASATCFVEFGDTASEHEQAEDRVHRIGQEADSVTAYYLIAEGTIDDDIMDRLKKGYENQKQVLDGERNANFMPDNMALDVIRARREKIAKPL